MGGAEFQKDQQMTYRTLGLVALLLATGLLSACAPLLIGGGGAIVADQVAEDQNGGDGLF